MLHNFIFIFIEELFMKKGQLFAKLKKIMRQWFRYIDD